MHIANRDYKSLEDAYVYNMTDSLFVELPEHVINEYWNKKPHYSAFRRIFSNKLDRCRSIIDSLSGDSLVICDPLGDLLRREEFVGLVLGDLETELVLDGHDQLHVVERVQTEVLDEI